MNEHWRKSVSKNEFAENDITKNIKKGSSKKTENDITKKSWTRNCPTCNSELIYSSYGSWYNAKRDGRNCKKCCKSIPVNKKYHRNCPNCKDIIYHRTEASRNSSLKNERWCHSCRNSGKNNPFYGKLHTEEHKKYMAENAPARRPEVKKKLSIAHRGKIMSESAKQKLSESAKKQFSTPESRRLLSERIRKVYEERPELRERIREKALLQQELYRQTDEYKHWLSKKSDYELYRIEVRRLTFENKLTILENWSKRNLYHKYEIDHIYPIRQAFKNNIPAELIGDIKNLRIIPQKENRSKSGKLTIIPEHIQIFLEKRL
jgi:hypothetical protein